MSAPTADAIGTDSAQTFETLRTKSPAGGTLRTSHTSTVAPERVSGAQSVVRSLEELGVDVVFGIPGGAILPAYDPLLDSQKVRHVLVRHEQGAGHAATGYAQIAGRAGVMMATSGPGATNLVTPLADAQMDSVPVVAITGQVGRGLIGTDAFQEADISGITMPITKHNFLVSNAADIPRIMAEAFYLAESGRPGAVLVDIPKDILQAQTTFSWPPQMDLPGYRPTTKPHGKQVREAARMILASKAPVLYVGGGVIKANASAQLMELAELTGIPVVTTLMARGAFPDSHRQHVGMPGMHGAVSAVAGLQRSDLLIALGTRFDDRVTGQLDSFAPGAKVIHADIDPAEIGKHHIVFLPCSGSSDSGGNGPACSGVFNTDPRVKTTLNGFVAKGGRIYVSDWSYEYVRQVFPGFVSWQGETQTIGSACNGGNAGLLWGNGGAGANGGRGGNAGIIFGIGGNGGNAGNGVINGGDAGQAVLFGAGGRGGGLVIEGALGGCAGRRRSSSSSGSLSISQLDGSVTSISASRFMTHPSCSIEHDLPNY